MINLPTATPVRPNLVIPPPPRHKPILIIVSLFVFGLVSLGVVLWRIQYRNNLDKKASAGIPSNPNPTNFTCNGKTFSLAVSESLDNLSAGEYSTFVTITLLSGGDNSQITYWKAECACNNDQGSDANGFCTTIPECSMNDNQTLALVKDVAQTITLKSVNGFRQNCGSFQNDLLVRKVDGVDCFSTDYPSAPDQFKVYGLCNNNQTTIYKTNCATNGLIAGSCPLVSPTPTLTSIPTPTGTRTPSLTPRPTNTPTTTPILTNTPTSTPRLTNTPTLTPSPTNTPAPNPTGTSTPRATDTPIPTNQPTATNIPNPTAIQPTSTPLPMAIPVTGNFSSTLLIGLGGFLLLFLTVIFIF